MSIDLRCLDFFLKSLSADEEADPIISLPLPLLAAFSLAFLLLFSFPPISPSPKRTTGFLPRSNMLLLNPFLLLRTADGEGEEEDGGVGGSGVGDIPRTVRI